MRPTDENQHRSTRPNLMSSGTRRVSSEDNILAMLERNAERGPLGAAPRIALYAGAGVLVLGLLSTLAWLVRENQGTNDALRVVEQAAVVPIPEPRAASAAAATAVRVDPAGSPATIVDDPQPAAAQKASAPATAQAAPAPLPPLVLLSEATAKHGARPERASATRAQPMREAPPAPELQRAHAAQPGAAAKAPARPRPVVAASPAPAQANSTASKTVARAAAGRPKKQQPTGSEPQPEAAADNDVALISAIISHSSRHAHERTGADTGAGGCAGGDKKCAARPHSPP